MYDLFHPSLPGRVVQKQKHQLRAAHAAGWLLWDELTSKQRSAHEAATGNPVREQARKPTRRVAQPSDTGPTDPDPEPTTPADGDTPKE